MTSIVAMPFTGLTNLAGAAGAWAGVWAAAFVAGAWAADWAAAFVAGACAGLACANAVDTTNIERSAAEGANAASFMG